MLVFRVWDLGLQAQRLVIRVYFLRDTWRAGGLNGDMVLPYGF